LQDGINRITLIRMTHSHISIRWIAVPALTALALVAAGFVFEASSTTRAPARVLVVVDQSAGRDPALVDRAAAAVRAAERAGADAQLRVTRTSTEQLSVTHYFAAKRYDTVVGVGLDRAIAVDPVARRYPSLRFALVDGAGLADALGRALR
jgi:basic membrane lipoprotein Med (substrate-binding protein (PBP1-ABC) superfamily)